MILCRQWLRRAGGEAEVNRANLVAQGEHDVWVDGLDTGAQDATESANLAVRVVVARRLVEVDDVLPFEVAHVGLRVELRTTDGADGTWNAELVGLLHVDVGVLILGGEPLGIDLLVVSAVILRIQDVGLHLLPRIGEVRVWIADRSPRALGVRGQNFVEVEAIRHVVHHVDVAIVGMADAQRQKERVGLAVAEVLTDFVIGPLEPAARELVGDEAVDRLSVLEGQSVTSAFLKGQQVREVIKNTIGEIGGGGDLGEGEPIGFVRVAQKRALDDILPRVPGEAVAVPVDPVEAHHVAEAPFNGLHLILALGGVEKVGDAEPRAVNSLLVEGGPTQRLAEPDVVHWRNAGAAVCSFERVERHRAPIGHRAFATSCVGSCVMNVGTLPHDVVDGFTHPFWPCHLPGHADPWRAVLLTHVDVVSDTTGFDYEELIDFVRHKTGEAFA